MQYTCVLSSDSKRCAECAKTGRSCDCTGVPLSAWKSVENALEKLQHEEREAERDHALHAAHTATAYARLVRIRKLKKLQEDRETELIRREAITLEEMDEAAGYPGLPGNTSPPNEVITLPSSDEAFTMPSPSFWEDLGLPNPSTPNPVENPPTTQGSLS